MPLRGTANAPKFTGKASLLPLFFEDVEQLSDAAAQTPAQKIRASIRYADYDESDGWEQLPEAAGNDWGLFVAAVKKLYPGCETNRHTFADLQTLVQQTRQTSMRSLDEFGEYKRKFKKITKVLVDGRDIADLDRDTIFMLGLPANLETQVRQRLMFTKPLHHPLKPYPTDDAIEAAEFLLVGAALTHIPSAAVAAITAGQTSAWAALAPPLQTVHPSQPASIPSTTGSSFTRTPITHIKQEQVTFQQTQSRSCAFCDDPNHFMGSCPHVDSYVQSGKATRGTDGRLYLPDGRRIPRVAGTRCLRECLDWLVAQSAPLPPIVTAGILSLPFPEIDAVLDIDPSVFLAPVEQDYNDNNDPAFADPAFQSYIAQAWASFQSDRKDKGKRLRFDGVEIPVRNTGRPPPRVPQVTEEIVSPAIEAAQSQVPESSGPANAISGPSRPVFAGPRLAGPPYTPTASIPPVRLPNADPAFAPAPMGQYRYTFPLEDDAAPKRVLDRVLEATVPVPVKELLAVAPDFRRQLKELATSKRMPVKTNTIQVNELAGVDPGAVARDFSDSIERNEDGLIVAHHSIPLRSLSVKVMDSDQSIISVLDSGSEIIAMPKRVWESLGLPVRSDHLLTMSNANTSTDQTIGVIENLRLDFGAGEVCLQVQVVPRANFDLLLGRPFHCLMSASTVDSPDGSQTITLTDPNSGKTYRLPTRPWTDGCPRCRRGLFCSSHQSVVEMGF